MSTNRGRSPPTRHARNTSAGLGEEETFMLPTRQIEAFGRTLNATASQIIGGDVSQHYHSALNDIHRELRRPLVQRSVFALSKSSPRELVRSNFSTSEIQQRALAHVPDELLNNVPAASSTYSLFQGFQASQPDDYTRKKKKHGRRQSKDLKLLEDGKDSPGSASGLKSKKHSLDHRLGMMTIRKNMCASEILELDKKIANLQTMRKLVVERLASLEQEEVDLEHELADVDNEIEELGLKAGSAAASIKSPTISFPDVNEESEAHDQSFMSESIYEKLSSPKTKKRRMPRRVSLPILHEHMEPGTQIKQFQAHNDMITALDFDVPFGTLVSAALDDTLRVWDLNAGRCIGMLEGHLSSVRCVQVEDNLVASGSNDATVRLWDLSQAEYTPSPPPRPKAGQDHDREEGEEEQDEEDLTAYSPNPSAMADCPLYTLSSHVAEITALHFSGTTLVSGSADKTLRQWDISTGRCVQTLDVLWAAAQASATTPSFSSSTQSANPPVAADTSSWWRPTAGRLPAAEADFVGALQCFQSAVACGTADSVIRLWDLRSGMVQRSLIGHTGPITALQFDDTHLVTGSMDRSIRIWDLRSGSIVDAYAYPEPVTAMMFDHARVCAAAGEPVVKIYDKADGRHWDCGATFSANEDEEESVSGEDRSALSTVERVRIRDGYLVEGRRDGVVGVWSC